jgi:hypothetical protein
MTQIEKIEKVRLASDVVCLVAVLLTHSAPPCFLTAMTITTPSFLRVTSRDCMMVSQ